MPSGVLSTILADGEPDLTIEQPPTSAKLDWDGFSAAYFPASRRHGAIGLDDAEAGYCSAVRLLEPGRKRRGRPTSFWLWSVAGLFAVVVVLGLVLR